MEFKFGVRGHDMASNTDIDSLLDIIQQIGIPNIQLVFPKALANHSYSDENVKAIHNSLIKHNINVSLLGAYFNPVHPDMEQVNKGISNFKENLRIASSLGCKYVGSETGSLNGSPWTYIQGNHSEETYIKSRNVFKGLADYAEKVGSQILIEPAWAHVVYCPSLLKRMIEEINSPAVHVTIDLFNLIYSGNYSKRDEIFTEALKTFKDEIKVIHLKDSLISENGTITQVAPGKGDFHYKLMLEAIKEYCPDAILTFEGVKRDQIEDAYSYLKSVAVQIKYK